MVFVGWVGDKNKCESKARLEDGHRRSILFKRWERKEEERKREQKKETMKGAAMQKRSVWMVYWKC